LTTFSFPVVCLARNPKTLLNKNGKSRHPCLLSGFRENGFSFSSFSMMLAIDLHIYTLIFVRYLPSIPGSIRAFNHEKMLNFCLRLFLHLFRW
jgi:hypothetical protein